MIVKVLSAAALAAAPVVAPEPIYIDYPMVVQVDCGTTRGTAFFANGRLISASHVTDAQCQVAGVPLHQAHEPGLDFSSEPAPFEGYKINCEGFKAGETYYAVGYANGLPRQRLITLTGTGEKAPNGMAYLWGYPTVIPGMSGGMITNTRAEVVGIVNMYHHFYPISLSRELRDTSLCKAEAA